MPGSKLKILIAEHSPSDIDLIVYELQKAGISFVPEIVDTERTFITALNDFKPDIILSDYRFPSFDGLRLFELKVKIAAEIPFIFVSGTIGEERAVQLIRNGVSDYALKDKLYTLPDKIIRALQETHDKREKVIIAEKLSKASRLYAFISQVNQNIVHVPDEAALFRNSCRMAIEFGKFEMAWIGIFNTAQKTISLVEQSGVPEADIQLFTDASYPEGGPQSSVLSTGHYFICNDVINDLKLPDWVAFSQSRGINSCMVLPINKSGKIIGTLNLYSAELNFSGPDEIKLLIELTGDISFALDLFERDKKHVEAEERIVKNEQRFRALVENSSDAMMILSAKGEVLYASPSIERILGFNEDEFLKVNLASLAHQDDLPVHIKMWEEAMIATGVPTSSYSTRVLKKNGTTRWIISTMTSMLHDPLVNGVVVNFRDATEEVLIAEQREFDKNNLDALINNMSDLLWSVDLQFRLITSNQPFDEMIKINFGHVLEKGENVLDASHTPEMHQQYIQFYERVFAGESFTEISHFQIPFESWTEISYSPICKGEEVVGAACHSRDITESKLAERNILLSESRLKEAQAISHIGNWEYDLESNVHIWSDELYSIFGVRAKNRKPSMDLFLSFVHPQDISKIKREVEDAFVSLQATSYNFRFIRADGALRYGRTERKFEFDQVGKPIRLLGVLHDITASKLIEEEREKMISSLVQHTKNLEQFTSIISHNLRAPVANILGLSNVLKNDISAEDRSKSEQYLFSATTQLDEMLKDLNIILQLKSEINEYKQTVHFAELVDTIKSSISALIEHNAARIITDFGQQKSISSLRSYLYSIFYNLILNSIKYKQRGVPPIIHIKSELIQDKIRITFQDNGIGIDLEKHGSNVFGLYKRFHDHTEGKGLGLFMVKTQVETLGGTIRVESTVNHGTEFIIELPI